MELGDEARGPRRPLDEEPVLLVEPDAPEDESSKVIAFLAGGAVIAGVMFAFLSLGGWDRNDDLTTDSIGRIEAPGTPSPTLRLPQRS